MAVVNNAAQYHVFGPAVLQVGTGTTKALQSLGVTRSGMTVRVQQYYRGFMSDVGGPEVPVDHQFMGEVAHIRGELVDWKEDTLRLLRAFAKAGLSGTDGTGVAIGTLVGGNGPLSASNYLPLAISGNGNEDPWYFPCVIVKEPQEFKLSSEQQGYNIEFFAFSYVAPGSTTRASLVTYARAIS